MADVRHDEAVGFIALAVSQECDVVEDQHRHFRQVAGLPKTLPGWKEIHRDHVVGSHLPGHGHGQVVQHPPVHQQPLSLNRGREDARHAATGPHSGGHGTLAQHHHLPGENVGGHGSERGGQFGEGASFNQAVHSLFQVADVEPSQARARHLPNLAPFQLQGLGFHVR